MAVQIVMDIAVTRGTNSTGKPQAVPRRVHSGFRDRAKPAPQPREDCANATRGPPRIG